MMRHTPRFNSTIEEDELQDARETGDPAVVQRVLACIDRRKRFRESSAAAQAPGVVQHEVMRPFGMRRACAQRPVALST